MLSRPENITPILEAVLELRPQTVTDVGAGFGKYGLLVREALAAAEAEDGNHEPTDFVFLEAWESARYFLELPALEAIYDRVIPERATADNHPNGNDLVLLIDVLEHLEHPEGIDLLEALLASNRAVIASTPAMVTMFDTPYYGHDSPGHKSQWRLDELLALAPPARVLGHPPHIHPNYIVLYEYE